MKIFFGPSIRFPLLLENAHCLAGVEQVCLRGVAAAGSSTTAHYTAQGILHGTGVHVASEMLGPPQVTIARPRGLPIFYLATGCLDCSVPFAFRHRAQVKSVDQLGSRPKPRPLPCHRFVLSHPHRDFVRLGRTIKHVIAY